MHTKPSAFSLPVALAWPNTKLKATHHSLDLRTDSTTTVYAHNPMDLPEHAHSIADNADFGSTLQLCKAIAIKQP